MKAWEKRFNKKYYYDKSINGEWLPRYEMSTELLEDIKDLVRQEMLAKQREILVKLKANVQYRCGLEGVNVVTVLGEIDNLISELVKEEKNET